MKHRIRRQLLQVYIFLMQLKTKLTIKIALKMFECRSRNIVIKLFKKNLKNQQTNYSFSKLNIKLKFQSVNEKTDNLINE